MLIPRNEGIVAESWATETARQILSQIVELNQKVNQHPDDVLTAIEVISAGRVFTAGITESTVGLKSQQLKIALNFESLNSNATSRFQNVNGMNERVRPRHKDCVRRAVAGAFFALWSMLCGVAPILESV